MLIVVVGLGYLYLNYPLRVDSDLQEQADVFEISPAEVYRRTSAENQNFIAAANHFNELENEILRESSLFRQERAEELLEDFTAEKVEKETGGTETGEAEEGESEAAGMTRQDVIDILNDREQIEIEDYGFYSIGNERNIQSAVIEPEKLQIWLSINQSLPAAGADFYGFQLKPEAKELMHMED